MPTPRPMPILPRSAVASSDFQPYCSPSNLNVTRESLHTKASRPPTIKRNTNSLASEAREQPQKHEGEGGKRESIKAKSLLTA